METSHNRTLYCILYCIYIIYYTLIINYSFMHICVLIIVRYYYTFMCLLLYHYCIIMYLIRIYYVMSCIYAFIVLSCIDMHLLCNVAYSCCYIVTSPSCAIFPPFNTQTLLCIATVLASLCSGFVGWPNDSSLPL